MTIYIINIVFILLFGGFIYSSNLKRKDTVYLSVVFLILIMISSLRHKNIGTDTSGYLNHFFLINYYDISIWDYSMEPIFILLNKISFYISTNPQIIVSVSSAIICILVGLRIHNSSQYPILSTYLFVSMYIYYQSFNGMRQYIAIAITFFFSKYIFEKKPLKYYLGILLAIGFHQTAIIFIPLYLLNMINQKKNIMILFRLTMVLLVLNLNSILSIFVGIFPDYAVYEASIANSGDGIRDMVISFSIYILGEILIYFYGKNKKIDELKIFIFLYFIISLIGAGNLVQRIGWYFSIYSILYIPEVLKVIKSRQIKTVLIYIILIFFFLLHLYLLLSNFHRVTPYKLFW